VRIGLDIDGVMYKWDATARYMLREVLPNSPYKDPVFPSDGGLHVESQSWFWIKDKVRPEHWKWLWTEGVKLGLFRYGHLYPGTIQAVKELAALGEVVLLTHRPKEAVGDTLAWLGFLNLPIAGVHILTNQENKGLVRPECDVYLDDKPENCLDVLRYTDGRAYCVSRPWNAGGDTSSMWPMVTRVAGWSEFIEKVREL